MSVDHSKTLAVLPPEVKKLGWVSFFADVASEMAYPILPLFVAVLGAPVMAMGAIEGAAEALVSFTKAGSGWQSDVSGKRTPWVRAGYFLSSLGKPLIALAYGWPMVLFSRLLDRLGKGLRTTPRDALIADVADPSIYGRAFGYHRFMDTAGALVGVLITWFLVWTFARIAMPEVVGYRWIFALALLPGLASFGLTLLIKEPVHRDVKVEKRSVRLGELPRTYWRALVITLIFAVGNSSDTFVLLRARDYGLSAADVVLAYALYNGTYMALSYPAGILSDRIGRWRVLALGWTVYALTYVGLAYLGKGYLWPLLALYGVYMGLTQGVSKALVADEAPKHAKGTAMGFFYMCTGIAVLGSSLLAGFLWDRFGPAAAFGFGACASVAAVLAIPLTGFMKRPFISGG